MRRNDWESRFAAYIGRVAREGFAWGRHDCALFAAGGVEAITGTDPAAAWRGRYRTLTGGLRVIRKAGHADHLAAARALFPAVPPGHGMEGDIAVIADDGTEALGLVQGDLVYVLRPDGLGLVPLTAAAAVLGVR